MTYNFALALRFKDALLLDLAHTLELTLICIALGTAFGFALGLARSARNSALSGVSRLYVEFFRGTPVIVQLFGIFFCLPLILRVELSNFASAAIALTLCMGAITAETFRASLKLIGREQSDACIALGLPRSAQALNVELPQTALRAIPTLHSSAVSLFNESSLVSAVGMSHLIYVGQNIFSNTAHPVEILTIAALIYFAVAFRLTRAVTYIERRILRTRSA